LVQFDIKNKRHFLKRVKCSTVELPQLYVGSTITVFSRQLLIIAYGDEASRRAVEARSQR
jgi:nucleoside-diphosphate kinase